MNYALELLNRSTTLYKIGGYSYFAYIVFTIVMFITSEENDFLIDITLFGLVIAIMIFLVLYFIGKYLEIKAKQIIKEQSEYDKNT